MSFDSVIDIVSLTNVILVMRFTINYVDIKRHLSGRRDLNPLPTAWEAVALPGELLPHSFRYPSRTIYETDFAKEIFFDSQLSFNGMIQLFSNSAFV